METDNQITVNMEQVYAWNPSLIFMTNFTTAYPEDLYGNTVGVYVNGATITDDGTVSGNRYGYYVDADKYKKDFQKVSDFIVDIQEMYLNPVKKEYYGYY